MFFIISFTISFCPFLTISVQVLLIPSSSLKKKILLSSIIFLMIFVIFFSYFIFYFHFAIYFNFFIYQLFFYFVSNEKQFEHFQSCFLSQITFVIPYRVTHLECHHLSKHLQFISCFSVLGQHFFVLGNLKEFSLFFSL